VAVTTKSYLYKASVDKPDAYKWKPSIFMPKEACRLHLRVVDVRAERLQEISAEDAIAEGVFFKGGKYKDYLDSKDYCGTAQGSFRSLWNLIHGTGAWGLNPWVWVIKFEKLEDPPKDTDEQRPILFSSEMVQAILEGRKTQTRRIILPRNNPKIPPATVIEKGDSWIGLHESYPAPTNGIHLLPPYGEVGDFVWVRESYCEDK